MLEQLQEIEKNALADLAQVGDEAQLESWRLTY
jgi:hypothetical protein